METTNTRNPWDYTWAYPFTRGDGTKGYRGYRAGSNTEEEVTEDIETVPMSEEEAVVSNLETGASIQENNFNETNRIN